MLSLKQSYMVGARGGGVGMGAGCVKHAILQEGFTTYSSRYITRYMHDSQVGPGELGLEF